ncbi:Chromosome partition protein smc [hydrothermal vent metagenome]|uniref:Chromosome partition protein smc n=1 Tax=hydrothermal vent metagenome TaxID=652676 RepID=A0A3B1A129_9ZZZZ
MRLRKIKLAGFKSFVDPTTILMPSNLIGVVGPNGCGKSNVIDAVRWVMGESSAKHLRGESITDVIFNGSTSRKPVGQALVELIFENNDGRLGGEYAQYSEISIKRTVSRDGQSIYYLNGARCRRRDITDIFLGTGLGPRSYAIIEQGTISRIIEAKPEELRVFIEEAAGISRYKERRRETENRIKHTRENLERLSDLRDELQKQIVHLDRQAKTAEKYKVLKEQERILKAQLLALHWKSLHDSSADTEKQISDKEVTLEAAIAQQREIEANIEKHREAHIEATDKFNEVQSRFYGVGGDIGRLEQSIQHVKERRQQLEQDITQLEESWKEAQTHLSTDKEKIEVLQTQKIELEPNLQIAQEKEQTSTAALTTSEQAMKQWQVSWDELNLKAADPAKNVEVERTRIQHLEQQTVQQSKRLETIESELNEQSPDSVAEQILVAQTNVATSEAKITENKQRLEQKLENISSVRDSILLVNDELNTKRGELQNLQGRKSSLEALQQAALGKQSGVVSHWLESNQLSEVSRLAEQMDVEQGWERALECVLGQNLQAVCVDDIDSITASISELTTGSVTLIDKTPVNSTESNTSLQAELLASKVNSQWTIDELISNVYCTETLDQAIQQRSQLKSNESVITKDGIWMGLNWLKVVRDDDAQAGVLQREQEIKQLNENQDLLASQINEFEESHAAKSESLSSLESERENEQAQLNQLNRELAEFQAESKSLTQRSDQVKARHEKLLADAQEVKAYIEKGNNDISESRLKLQDALDEISLVEEQRVTELKKRDDINSELEAIRLTARADRDNASELKIRFETVRTELSSTQNALERMTAQLEQLSTRKSELESSLTQCVEPIDTMVVELEQMLEKRIIIENELIEVRSKVESLDHDMREFEKQRHASEECVQLIRSELETVRISWQESKVRLETFDEQITESGFELKILLEEMPENAKLETWEENVQSLDRKINRLGPINLAAIEEYQTQFERKEYLDKQDGDLIEALETLEGAIRKIDKETRTRFKETYDKVNTGLQQFFPRLFGGGHAYLELVGEDLLTAGVTVMARPPGKKNSTIHLLSGGEKALTAVALVYSIFQLNPAPFCMLDEVDAPLDDANVGRYCDLIKAMSDKTQFVFITHNKITMEIAEHLTGVTMNEPGVSHLVAVDMQEAVKLAAV